MKKNWLNKFCIKEYYGNPVRNDNCFLLLPSSFTPWPKINRVPRNFLLSLSKKKKKKTKKKKLTKTNLFSVSIFLIICHNKLLILNLL